MAGPMIKGGPCRVTFAGWQSTTPRLQQAGWQLAAEHCWDRDQVRLVMNHEGLRMQMYAESDWRPLAQGPFGSRDQHMYAAASARDDADLNDRRYPSFHVVHVANQLHIKVFDVESFGFEAIDARTSFIESESKSMDDFKIWMAPLVKTEEIIVEPDTVADLMAKIRQMQQPELQAIRERNRRMERGEAMDPTRYHAQIISLAA